MHVDRLFRQAPVARTPHTRQRLRPLGLGGVLALLLAGTAPVAQAQIGNSAGYASNGTYAGSILWLDFAGYNDATAATGQPFSFNLPNGNRLSMTVTRTGTANVVNASQVPTWFGAAFGNGAYDSIPGRPVLYGAGVISYTVNLSNLVATDSAGNPRRLEMVVADGESTGLHELESLDFTTNGGAWQLVELLSQPGSGGAAPTPTLTGVGTTTARWQGASDVNYGSVLLRSVAPTTLGITASTNSGAQGFLVGVVLPRVELRKQFPDGLLNPADSVTIASAYASPALPLGSVVTSGAGGASTGAVSVWPDSAIELGETGAALANYTSSIQCNDNGPVMPIVTPLPSGPGTQFSVTPQFGNDIVCTLINLRGALPANVAISKTLSGESGSQAGIAEPGETLTYTIRLVNSGAGAANGFAVSDNLDPNLDFVSASNGGIFASGFINWSGLSIPANSSLDLTVTSVVRSPIPAGVLQVANLAYATGTTPPDCPPAGPQCVIRPTAGQATLSKSVVDENGNGQAEAGELLTYSITLGNTGGTALSNYALTDVLDANTSFVSASNGGSHAAGVVSWSGLSVPANSSIVLNVVVRVANPVPMGVQQIANLVHPTGTTPPNCSKKPIPTTCAVIPLRIVPRLAISKSVDIASAAAGNVTYTVSVRNVGTIDAAGSRVTDPIPAGLGNFAWTCAANGGATCPNAAGIGAINELIASFPVGSSLLYTITATVNPGTTGAVINTAQAVPPNGGLCGPDDSAPPCTATVEFVPAPPYQAPAAAPIDNRIALLLMGLLLLIGAARSLRQRN